MAKLKYDRVINISARSSSRVQIPNDEVWKVTTSPHNSNVDAFVKLYGGGTVSKSKIQMELYQASPSNTSKSKRLHGGGAPWLRNLFLTGRFGLRDLEAASLSRMEKFGNWATVGARKTTWLWWRVFLTLKARSTALLEEDQSSIYRRALFLPASLLRSWRNNVVEGVTLYA